MKNKLALLFFVVVSTILWNSCTVTKRYHNRGFNIDFGFKNKAVESPKVAISKASVDSNAFDPTLESVSKAPANVYTPNQDAIENPESFEVQRNDLDVTVPDTGISEGNRAVEKPVDTMKEGAINKKIPKASMFFGLYGLFSILIGIAIAISAVSTFALFFAELLIIGGIMYLAIAFLIFLIWG